MVEGLEDVQGLEHRGPLRPGLELVDVDAAIGRHHRLFDLHFPAREILQSDEPALFVESADEFLRDVAFVEAVVGRVDRVAPVLALAQRPSLGVDQLAERRREIGLPEDLSRLGRLTCFAQMRQHHRARIAPLLQPALVPLDRVGRLFFDGVAVRHPDRRLEHVAQTQRPVLGEYRHQTARRPRCDRGEGSVLGGELHALRAIEVGRSAGRCNAEGVDRDDLLGAGIVDQRLRLTTPRQHIPHRRDGGEHCAGGVDGVAALREHHRARGGSEWFAGDRNPVATMQRGLLCALPGQHDRNE